MSSGNEHSMEFTNQERADALRRTAAWCREGAPGGNGGSIFDTLGPCALGKALLELHNDMDAWAKARATSTSTSTIALAGGINEAQRELEHVASHFDLGGYHRAARHLEVAADMLVSS